ncbi:hypothetical protein [Streptomyces sp. NPDC055912]|uniref:hypothetical protein n=1 Tax=Streptomyces sp. NPDC055912 TaxID=3345660 RepID=UPI0035DCDF8F
MATTKDMKQLRKRLEGQGFRLKVTKKNHYQVFAPKEEETENGEKEIRWTFVTVLPSTPSEYRGMKNSIAELKRAGFVPA